MSLCVPTSSSYCSLALSLSLHSPSPFPSPLLGFLRHRGRREERAHGGGGRGSVGTCSGGSGDARRGGSCDIYIILPCNYGNNMIIGPRITVIAPTNSPSIFAAIVNSNKSRVVLMSFFKIKNVNRE